MTALRLVTLEHAEVEGQTWGRRVTVPAGTVVDLGSGYAATITAKGLACDCGKGVLCPHNPQHRLVREPLEHAILTVPAVGNAAYVDEDGTVMVCPLRPDGTPSGDWAVLSEFADLEDLQALAGAALALAAAVAPFIGCDR